MDCGPLHAPLAVHALTPIDDQVSTALSPSTMVVGLTVIVTLGVGAGGGGGRIGMELVVPNEQLKKEEACAQSAMRPAHQTSTLDRELRLFDTCMARAALIATRAEPDRVGPCAHSSPVACVLQTMLSVYPPGGPLASEGTARAPPWIGAYCNK